jgi:hypothetical protein
MKFTIAFAILPLLASVTAAPTYGHPAAPAAKDSLLDLDLGVGLGLDVGGGSSCSLAQKLVCKIKHCSKYLCSRE